MTNIAKPTIHLNGTSGEDLIREYTEASYLLSKAEEALNNVTTHARDYYVQSPDVWPTARQQQTDRIAAIHRVKEEVSEILQDLYNQYEARIKAKGGVR